MPRLWCPRWHSTSHSIRLLLLLFYRSCFANRTNFGVRSPITRKAQLTGSSAEQSQPMHVVMWTMDGYEQTGALGSPHTRGWARAPSALVTQWGTDMGLNNGYV